MKLSGIVREVIRLGDASRAYWDKELPKRHPRYPVIGAGEESGPPPPEDAQIHALLKRLSTKQLYTLIVLMYVGRGDFSADDLPRAYQTMKEALPSKELVIAQMMGENSLAEYLTDALEAIQKRHIDLDSRKFASAVAAS